MTARGDSKELTELVDRIVSRLDDRHAADPDERRPLEGELAVLESLTRAKTVAKAYRHLANLTKHSQGSENTAVIKAAIGLGHAMERLSWLPHLHSVVNSQMAMARIAKEDPRTLKAEAEAAIATAEQEFSHKKGVKRNTIKKRACELVGIRTVSGLNKRLRKKF